MKFSFLKTQLLHPQLLHTLQKNVEQRSLINLTADFFLILRSLYSIGFCFIEESDTANQELKISHSSVICIFIFSSQLFYDLFYNSNAQPLVKKASTNAFFPPYCLKFWRLSPKNIPNILFAFAFPFLIHNDTSVVETPIERLVLWS